MERRQTMEVDERDGSILWRTSSEEKGGICVLVPA